MWRIVSVALMLAVSVPASEVEVLFGSYPSTPLMFWSTNTWLATKNQSVGIVNVGWNHVSTIPASFKVITNVWHRGAVPMISWMPYPYNTWAHPSPNDDIAAGKYDTYINAFLKQLVTFVNGPDGHRGTADDRRVYLRFASQMNGNWFPWSPQCPSCGSTGQHINQTTESFVKMWKHVMGIVRGPQFNLTGNWVQVVFCVNAADAVNEPYTMEEMFPGVNYVDWVAITGYNWGNTIPGNNWASPRDVFFDMLQRLSGIAPGLPVALASAASTSVPRGTAAKNAWIGELFEFVNSTGVRMLTYHNADSSTDLAAFGGAKGYSTWTDPYTSDTYAVYPALREGLLNSSYIVGSNASNPRLITDAQFAGAAN